MLTILAALGVFSVLAIAQDVSSDVSISFAAPATEPLDLGQKYLYSLDRIAGPTAWLGFAASAGIDQLWKKPGSWGDNSGSFGERIRGDQRTQLADQARGLAERQIRLDAIVQRGEPGFLQAGGRASRELLIGHVGQRRAAPQRERLTQQASR